MIFFSRPQIPDVNLGTVAAAGDAVGPLNSTHSLNRWTELTKNEKGERREGKEERS